MINWLRVSWFLGHYCSFCFSITLFLQFTLSLSLFSMLSVTFPPPLCVYFTPVSTFILHFIVIHAQTLRTQTILSQMLPIFMTFCWFFFSHWNNSLDRRCCHDVNTIPFGWLQSIKKNSLFFVHSNRSAFLVYLCREFHHMAYNNMTLSTGSFNSLALYKISLYFIRDTHTVVLVEWHQSNCSIKCKSCYLLVWG